MALRLVHAARGPVLNSTNDVLPACLLQVKPVYRGTCYLELTYTPFRKPDIAPTGAGASPAAAGDVAAATGMGAVKPTDMVGGSSNRLGSLLQQSTYQHHCQWH